MRTTPRTHTWLLVLAFSAGVAGLALVLPPDAPGVSSRASGPSTKRSRQALESPSPVPSRPLRSGSRAAPTRSGPGKTVPAPSGRQADSLAFFSDTTTSLAQRRERVRELARRGDPRSLRLLMHLGDSHRFLNWAAVEALGRCDGTGVSTYLEEKLHHPNHQVVRAAVAAYARLRGREAATELVDVLRENRNRPDGYGEDIRGDIVQLLGKLRAVEATAALVEELSRAGEAGWSMEYGSVLVRALARIGNHEARLALERYAGLLAGRLPADPLARKYYLARLAEVRQATREIP